MAEKTIAAKSADENIENRAQSTGNRYSGPVDDPVDDGRELPPAPEEPEHEKFSLAKYLSRNEQYRQEFSDEYGAYRENRERGSRGERSEFQAVLGLVRRRLDAEWEDADDATRGFRLEKETRALIGCPEEVAFYKEKIRGILTEERLIMADYPPWYTDLTEAVFAELYGLSGLASWAYDMLPQYAESSSAKLIGDRMYCLIDGKSELQPQRIPDERREKLKRTLLLATPEERVEYGFHEVYLTNGIRVTIYSGSRTKKGQDVIVMRKYLMKNRLTFEDLVELKTIPPGSPDLFRLMVKIGFNVMFVGEVRSGKTTMMQTWQACEDRNLEGLAVASDTETPWHEIMPDAPIMQLVGEGQTLLDMMKSILRGDNDYVLLEEMRDAYAYRMFLDILSTGTRRSKATIHDRSAVSAAYKMAAKIREQFGGSLPDLIAQIYQSVNYVFECCQDPENRAHKILTRIVELTYDVRRDAVCARTICRYDFEAKTWQWNAWINTVTWDDFRSNRPDLLELLHLMTVMQEQNQLHGCRKWSFPAYYPGNQRLLDDPRYLFTREYRDEEPYLDPVGMDPDCYTEEHGWKGVEPYWNL